MINSELIRPGVLDMFRTNLGLKDGERVLVLTDTPTATEWKQKQGSELEVMLTRSLLAKAVGEIAKEGFPACPIEFYAYPSVGRSGAELGPRIAKRMLMTDVIIAITTYSLSHTDARTQACRAGARVASMPAFFAEMFYPGAIMSSDYEAIALQTTLLADCLTKADEARVRSKGGTDLRLRLDGRKGLADTGLLRERGTMGNLPAGEAYVAPVEGTGNGKLVVEAGWFPGTEDMTLHFRDGVVERVEGGGSFGADLRVTLGMGQEGPNYRSRRNLAELGIGTNPNAKSVANRLEAEKMLGTIHVAIGDNAHIGGLVSADLHWDFIIPQASVVLDGKEIMSDGKLLI